MLTISLLEWQNHPARTAQLCALTGCADAEELGERLAPLVSVRPTFREGEIELVATRKVGELQVGELMISVMPHVSGDALLRVLGWMLGANVHLIDGAMGMRIPSYSEGFSLRKALAAGLVISIRQIVRHELHRDYKRQQERLLTLRGQPDFARQGIRPDALGLPCRYLELTRDTLPNRALHGALEVAHQLLSGTSFEQEAARHHQAFSQLVPSRQVHGGAQLVTLEQLRQAQEMTVHRYPRYAASLVLARLLLFGGGPVSVIGDGGMSGWWVDMPSLFEHAVIQGATRWAERRGLRAQAQPRYQGAILGGQARVYREARPDLILRDGNSDEVLALLDAKYKPYFRAKTSTHSKDGAGAPLRPVDREDLFQMAMYIGLAPGARYLLAAPFEPDWPAIAGRYRTLTLHEQRLQLVPVALDELARRGELALW